MTYGPGPTIAASRRTLMIVLAVLLLFNSVVVGVLLFRGDDTPAALEPQPTVTATTTVTATVTATPSPRASVLGREFDRSTGTAPEPVTQPPAAAPQPVQPDPAPQPPTTSVCRNSHDRACGPVFWRPAPGANAPLSMDAGFEPNAPTVGETVTFTVDAVDPDARVICCDVAIDGKRLSNTLGCAHKRYGRWDTPAKRRGSVTDTYEHVFTRSGTHTVTFYAVTGSTCAHPYKNTGSITLEFVVFGS